MTTLTCKKATDLLLDFVEDALPPAEAAAMHAHLAACASCRQFLDSYRRTVRLCAAAPGQPAPAGLGARLLERLRREAAAGRPR